MQASTSDGHVVQHVKFLLVRICECFMHTLGAAVLLCIGFGIAIEIYWEVPTFERLWGFVDVFGICAAGGTRDRFGLDCITF